MPFIVALDQGTTSSRAIVFDHAGRAVASAQAEFRQIFPQPGWVEHDPDEIWASQSGVLHAALAKAGIGADDIAAIGITNQRETTLLWDRATGKPVRNAIVWQDRRTAGLCDALREAGHASAIAAQDRAGDRCLLFRHQAQVAAGQRAGRAQRAPRRASSPSAPSIRGWSGT